MVIDITDYVNSRNDNHDYETSVNPNADLVVIDRPECISGTSLSDDDIADMLKYIM